MKWIVDSSVAIKWFVEEDDSDDAIRLVNIATSRGIKLIAPDFLLIEIANILWKKTFKNEISNNQAIEILSVTETYFEEIIPARELLKQAQAFSQSLNHPIYDCLYLATTSLSKGSFITADAKLYNKMIENKLEIKTILLSNVMVESFN